MLCPLPQVVCRDGVRSVAAFIASRTGQLSADVRGFHSRELTAGVEATVPMTAFMMFSSANGIMGGMGSPNYAAANVCLDSLAGGQRTHGREALSVQWGPWGGVGMVADGALAKIMEASGFTPIRSDVGMPALQALLRPYMPPVSCFMLVKWAKVLGGVPQTPLFYSVFAPQAKAAASVACAPDGPIDLSVVLELVQHAAGGGARTKESSKTLSSCFSSSSPSRKSSNIFCSTC